jgi:hypothetical protein
VQLGFLLNVEAMTHTLFSHLTKLIMSSTQYKATKTFANGEKELARKNTMGWRDVARG